MKKLKPPKRSVRKNGIPLDDNENSRFLEHPKVKRFSQTIEMFISETDLYLRGRWDGPARSGTEPCGYVFISRDSFDKGHAKIMFFDPMSNENRLMISFGPWIDILPFSKEDWDCLDDDDRLQKKNRIIELTSDKKLKRAIRLAKIAHQTFDEAFDLNVDLLRDQRAKVRRKP